VPELPISYTCFQDTRRQRYQTQSLVLKEIIMSAGIPSIGQGTPAVVSGASRSVAAPQNPSASDGGKAPAAPNVDFSSTVQSLVKTLEDSRPDATGGNLNTYA
jgi:hypothetical protein